MNFFLSVYYGWCAQLPKYLYGLLAQEEKKRKEKKKNLDSSTGKLRIIYKFQTSRRRVDYNKKILKNRYSLHTRFTRVY